MSFVNRSKEVAGMPALLRRRALPDGIVMVAVACLAVVVCLFAGEHVDA